MTEIKLGYFQECDELLEELADGLEALAGGSASPDSFNAVFRAVHSIKGGAAAFGLSDLTDFAHGFETHLATFRDAGSVPSPEAVPPLQIAADRLATLVSLASKGVELSDEERLADAALLSTTDAHTAVRTLDLILKASQTEADPRGILKGLEPLGTVETRLDPESVPDIEAFDPGKSQLAWTVQVITEASLNSVEKTLSALDPEGAASLVGSQEPVSRYEETAAAPVASSAVKPASPATETVAAPPTIRVGLNRIDRLINLVGELVINQAMLARSAEDLGAQSNSDHMLGLEELMRLTRDLQDSVMQIRAQPVKPLFQRMARICREAATSSGKVIDLVYEGQDTEVDKTVIERLSDPLTHMIRNAVDHAIELPEARETAGKKPTGTITLRASHRSGQVILEVIDDGAGIDRAKVLDRARSKGLVPPNADLSPAEIDHLLFLPGFSTADQVSALSGRGVGMDVVRSAINALGGRITIDSTPGEGTRFEIALPLTLAVLDAMIVSVGDQTLVLPLSTIHETITVQSADLLELTPGARMLRYYGNAIALFDLGEELGYFERRNDLEDCVAMIIQADGQPPVALVIDEIHEQRQVVIKGLQDGFSTASSVAAATILGDGRIALIIDPFDPSLSAGQGLASQQSAIPLDLSA